MEGRAVSDSEDEEPEADEAAEEAAVRAAELDGAQVERIESGSKAGELAPVWDTLIKLEISEHII